MYIRTQRALAVGVSAEDTFRKGSSTRYDDEKIERIQSEVMDLIGDYYNSKQIAFKDIYKKYGMSAETLREKIVKPLIKQGKLYKHAFHFGKATSYDEEYVKNLAKKQKIY